MALGVFWTTPVSSQRLILDSPFRKQNGVISPNGQWLAYQSDESGQDEIYLRGFPKSNEKHRGYDESVPEHPRPASLESMRSPLIDESQACGEGWRGNNTSQKPRETRRTS